MQTQQNQYLREFWNEIEETAKELLKIPMPQLRQEDFELFYQTGNRLVYEASYFGRRKYLTVYGMLAVYRGAKEDIDRLVQTLQEVCEERYWALPAHVNAKTRDELTIDLFAAETAQTISEMVYLLQDKLDKVVKVQLLDEIMRRVMIPYMEKRVTYGWETDPCNWSAVCAGSVGMAAIYLYRMGSLTIEQRDECIKRVCASMQCYIGGLEEDGACTEGLGYYSYGMSYFAGFALLAFEETQGAVDLMKGTKCEKIAVFQQKCYFGKGVSVSFSDGSSRECFLPGLTAYLKHCFPKVVTPDYASARGLHQDNCYRWLTNERNIRWLLAYGEDSANADGDSRLKEYNFLPVAEWMIYKDEYGNGYAAKGGHNAESHNHNDVGHFLVVYNGEMFLADLGAGEYTKDYFGKGRYDILCNRSLGHSVPLINGAEQCAGREYQAKAFIWKEEEKLLKISFADAYAKGELKALDRDIRILEDMTCAGRLCLELTDCFAPSEETCSIVENFVTQYEPVVDNESILLQGECGKCRIVIDNAKNIRILPRVHRNHEGKSEKAYLLQWDVVVEKNKMSKCVVKIVCE